MKISELFTNYIALTSLDIQGAFDNVEWRDILKQFRALGCPGNLAGELKTYLSERSFLINWAHTTFHIGWRGVP